MTAGEEHRSNGSLRFQGPNSGAVVELARRLQDQRLAVKDFYPNYILDKAAMANQSEKRQAGTEDDLVTAVSRFLFDWEASGRGYQEAAEALIRLVRGPSPSQQSQKAGLPCQPGGKGDG